MRAFLSACLSLMCLVSVGSHAAQRLVTLTSSEYPPYYGSDLPKNGAIAEVVVEAFRLVGYQVNLRFYPFPRALQAAQSGECDGMIALWHRQEREQWFVFSAPLASNTLGFYKRKDAAIQFTSLADLGRYRIGVVRGYATPSAFDAAWLPGVKQVTLDIQNLRKLGLGRLDLALIDKAQGAYLIKHRAPELAEVLEWLEPSFDADPMHLVFSKSRPGYEQRHYDFNRGLALLAKSGQLAKILAAHGL